MLGRRVRGARRPLSKFEREEQEKETKKGSHNFGALLGRRNTWVVFELLEGVGREARSAGGEEAEVGLFCVQKGGAVSV